MKGFIWRRKSPEKRKQKRSLKQKGVKRFLMLTMAMKEMIGDFLKEGILEDKQHVRKLPGFKEFYKIAVPLPVKFFRDK